MRRSRVPNFGGGGRWRGAEPTWVHGLPSAGDRRPRPGGGMRSGCREAGPSGPECGRRLEDRRPPGAKVEPVSLRGECCWASASRAESHDIGGGLQGGFRPSGHVACIEQSAPGRTTSLDYLWAGAGSWSPVNSGRRLAAGAL
ncbi:hypothetical protein NDU88_002423 [Pleurodeles waltl]|uniref:Uncharacterized protein n=1 Tax=Pleurodeles waltl TaxID=8319 RepID=A0AAV7UYM6_PLEWA|nr:hypothetical protein NDU88_002423 [Pleurodeles waltl]